MLIDSEQKRASTVPFRAVVVSFATVGSGYRQIHAAKCSERVQSVNSVTWSCAGQCSITGTCSQSMRLSSISSVWTLPRALHKCGWLHMLPVILNGDWYQADILFPPIRKRRKCEASLALPCPSPRVLSEEARLRKEPSWYLTSRA